MNVYELVQRAKSGDDEAFCELINSYKLKLYRTAYAYCKNEDDAIDIVSDTVYKVYMKIETLNNPQFFNTWITKILINTAKDFLSKQNRVILIDENDKLEGLNYQPEINHDNLNDNIDLYNAIDKLSEKHKRIIMLRFFDDLSLSEIARKLKYPIGTVKSYLNRAIGKLRCELKEESK